MRKLRLKVSDDTAFEFKLPNWAAETKQQSTAPTFGRQSLLKFTTKLGGWLIMAAASLFGFVFLFTQQPGAEVPYLFLMLMFVTLALSLIGLVLVGWRYLVDPPLFVHVLIFALIVIATYLFAPLPAKLGAKFVGANTFGIEGAHIFAGLYIMGFVGLFYFTHLLINTRAKLNILATSIITGIAIGTALSMLNPEVAKDLVLVSLIALPVLFNYLILGGRQLLGVISLIGFGLALILLFQNPAITLGMILAVLAGLVCGLLLQLKTQNWEIKSPIANMVVGVRKYFDSKLRLIELAKENALVLNMVALGLWFIISIVWIIANRVELSGAIQSLVSTYSSLGVMIGAWPSWLLGRGITLDPRATTFASIILYQGLLGAIAYIMIGITALYITIKATTKDDYALILAPVIIMIPVLGLFNQLSFIGVALWWMVFSYMAVSVAEKKEDLVLEVANKFQMWRFSLQKHLTWIQFVLIGVIVIATIYFIPLLRQQLV